MKCKSGVADGIYVDGDMEVFCDGGEENGNTGDKGDAGASDSGAEDKEIFYPDDSKGDDDNADKEDDKDKNTDKTGDDNDPDKDTGDKEADKDKDKSDDAPDVIKAEDLKFSEGLKIDEAIQEKFLELINNKEMSVVDKAQAFVDLQQSMFVAQSEAHQDQIDAWEKETTLDSRFVGETGDKLDENRAIAKKALDVVNVKGLKELLSREQTGLGSHPVVFDLFLTIGRTISEDTFKTGGVGGGAGPKSDKELLYPNQNK